MSSEKTYREEPITMIVSVRRIADDVERRREVMMQKESTPRRLEGEQLSTADIAELMDINEVSLRPRY